MTLRLEAISFSASALALTPRRKRLTVSRGMELSESFGPALRGLRKAAGLTQQELSDRSRVGFAMISRYERSIELPQVGTLLRLLEAMGTDFLGLAQAIAAAQGREVPQRPGAARSLWVAVLMRNGISPPVLEGIALGAVLEPNGFADLVASAEAAARQIAEEAFAAVQRAELALVAELPAEYDAGKGKR